MRCPSCLAENAATRRFCARLADPLPSLWLRKRDRSEVLWWLRAFPPSGVPLRAAWFVA